MNATASPGGDLPSTDRYYNVSISTFTVAGGAAASPYEITGSRKSVPISAVKNVAKANVTDDEIIAVRWAHLSALITTNTTDTADIAVQYSTDGGATWNFITGVFATLTAASQNKSVTKNFTSQELFDIELAGVATNNEVLFRCVVEDATSPTTNVLTITNIRATLGLIVMQ